MNKMRTKTFFLLPFINEEDHTTKDKEKEEKINGFVWVFFFIFLSSDGIA